MISYAPFWETLQRHGISTYSLIKDYKISSSTLTRLRHDKPFSTVTINDLCRVPQNLKTCTGETIMLMESGTDVCPCKRAKCERHGKCAACMEHHRTKKHPPACKRENKKAK
jgi:hypothetical protein